MIQFEIPKNSKVLLLWSGGYDSTLLLTELKRQGYIVDTIYFDLDNNYLKSKREIYCRYKIIKSLEEKFSIIHKDKIVKIANINKPYCNYVQPLIWLYNTVLHMEIDIDYICLGFIRCSDFWHQSYQWCRSFKDAQSITLRNKLVKPIFPLEYKNKSEILEYFLTYYPQIYKQCHTCEIPIIKNSLIVDCGKCDPCKNLKTHEVKFN
jgi:7-cyano-7-deazaguanine synthase in queuosine biosynthesis